MAENTPAPPCTSARTLARTLVFGDIHGCLLAFENILENINLTEEDTIIFLGDYVDRGPDSKGVIDKIIQLRETYNVITLKGNHEEIMQLADLSLSGYAWWRTVGGDITLRSFDCDVEDIDQTYWDFIDSLKLYHETENHIYVHAGLKPNIPLTEQDEDTLLWLRFPQLKPHSSGKRIVCGHTPQRGAGLPTALPHAICVDTHSYGALGYLTCLDMDTGDCYQANRNGKYRKEKIDLSI